MDGSRATPLNLCSKTAAFPGRISWEKRTAVFTRLWNLQNERIVLASQAVGEASQAIEITLDWVKQRRVFNNALWTFQAVRQRLSMLSAKVEAARAFVYNVAWRDTLG